MRTIWMTSMVRGTIASAARGSSSSGMAAVAAVVAEAEAEEAAASRMGLVRAIRVRCR